MIGLAGVWYPEARSTAMPGTNCPVSATTTSGKAMFSAALRVNVGVIHTGVARPTTRASLCNCPVNRAMAQPTTSTAITA
ncbi:hypothetical protein D3C75_1016560 [compost metagenome]